MPTKKKRVDLSRASSALQVLIPNIKGNQYPIGEDGYDVHNYQYATSSYGFENNMQPRVIVRPTGIHDIRTVVKYAKNNGVSVAVRTGGHQYSGASSTSDPNILLDLKDTFTSKDDLKIIGAGKVYTSVSWDLLTFNMFLGRNNLFVPHGQYGNVHLGGHVQTGGYGQLGRSFGLMGDNVICLQIINSDGELEEISKSTNPDLFYAILGGSPGNFGVITHFTIGVYSDKDYEGSCGLKAAYVYTRKTLKNLLNILVEISEDDDLPRNYDYCVIMLSSGSKLYDYFDMYEKEELDKYMKKHHSDLLDESLKLGGESFGYLPPIIIVYAQWTKINKDDKPDMTWFYKIKNAGGLGFNDVLMKDSMSKLTNKWIFRNIREFDMPYNNRTYITNSKTLSKDGWANWVTKRVDKIVSDNNNGCKVSVRVQNYNGKYSKFFTNRNNGTSYSWRDSTVVCVLDCFYNNNEISKNTAYEWQNINDAEGIGQNGKFSKQDKRVLWGSYGDFNMINSWPYYYENIEKYNRLCKIRKGVDPYDVFASNSFCVGKKLHLTSLQTVKKQEYIDDEEMSKKILASAFMRNAYNENYETKERRRPREIVLVEEPNKEDDDHNAETKEHRKPKEIVPVEEFNKEDDDNALPRKVHTHKQSFGDSLLDGNDNIIFYKKDVEKIVQGEKELSEAQFDDIVRSLFCEHRDVMVFGTLEATPVVVTIMLNLIMYTMHIRMPLIPAIGLTAGISGLVVVTTNTGYNIIVTAVFYITLYGLNYVTTVVYYAVRNSSSSSTDLLFSNNSNLFTLGFFLWSLCGLTVLLGIQSVHKPNAYEVTRNNRTNLFKLVHLLNEKCIKLKDVLDRNNARKLSFTDFKDTLFVYMLTKSILRSRLKIADSKRGPAYCLVQYLCDQTLETVIRWAKGENIIDETLAEEIRNKGRRIKEITSIEDLPEPRYSEVAKLYNKRIIYKRNNWTTMQIIFWLVLLVMVTVTSAAEVEESNTPLDIVKDTITDTSKIIIPPVFDSFTNYVVFIVLITASAVGFVIHSAKMNDVCTLFNIGRNSYVFVINATFLIIVYTICILLYVTYSFIKNTNKENVDIFWLVSVALLSLNSTFTFFFYIVSVCKKVKKYISNSYMKIDNDYSKEIIIERFAGLIFADLVLTALAAVGSYKNEPQLQYVLFGGILSMLTASLSVKGWICYYGALKEKEGFTYVVLRID